MYTERFEERHETGLVRLTGSNRGLLYTNEREEHVDVENTETGKTETKAVWVYDVYEISDAREFRKVKDEVVKDEHPYGDELKILRKTIAKILKDSGLYDNEEFSEFKIYNEFVESI